MNIVLIGMRRVGKSNVSRRLGFRTKHPVLSTDVLIEYETGQTIPQLISESDGNWREFREIEFQVVQKVARLDGMVVDCGGGIVVDLDENDREVFSERKVDLLRASGPIVWLRGDIARLAAKAKRGEQRPTLDTSRSAEQIMRNRLPFYERAADHIIDVEGRDRADLVEQIVSMFPEELRIDR